MTYLMCIKDCFTKEWQKLIILGHAWQGMPYDLWRMLLSWHSTEQFSDLTLRTDNCPQYISKKFRSAMKSLRIKLEYIHKHIPEDNGNVESFHYSIKTDYIRPNEFRKKFLNN